MYRNLQNVVVALFALLLVVFSSGVNLYQHHCFVENNTEIVFCEDDIECTHHDVCGSSCCNCSDQHACSNSDNHTPDDSSLQQESCVMKKVFLVVDKYCVSDNCCSIGDADLWCDLNLFLHEKIAVDDTDDRQSWIKFYELVRCPLSDVFYMIINCFYIYRVIQSM